MGIDNCLIDKQRWCQDEQFTIFMKCNDVNMNSFSVK